MEPELQILPAFVFLLLYQEHKRRWQRPRVLHPARGGLSSVGAFGAHWPAVLVGAVSCEALLVAAVSLAAVLVVAVSLAAVLVA
ncbi:hypothetical protein NDU88_009134 [Pleurodeles waltl]|uniref:Uncharacterized protein n=1 Tax=Pleurodeles waltl TaxID=8319 RepID=A0AAV7QQP4_PLEWA|nr:hypothetical protein NDU88_009134 [Pleurodeles waltl]